MKEMNLYEMEETERQPTEALGCGVLGYEKRTFPYYLGDLDQHVLHSVDLGRRTVFLDEFVGLSDSGEESSNRLVAVHLR